MGLCCRETVQKSQSINFFVTTINIADYSPPKILRKREQKNAEKVVGKVRAEFLYPTNSHGWKILDRFQTEDWIENDDYQQYRCIWSLGKPCEMSRLGHLAGHYDAQYGVDGDEKTMFYMSGGDENWWRVDLESLHTIVSLGIRNRGKVVNVYRDMIASLW